MILEFKNEIAKCLAERNIYVILHDCQELIYSGLILNAIFDNEIVDSKVKIAYARGDIEETDAEYNLYFAPMNDSEKYYAEHEFLKKDETLNVFFNSKMKIGSSFYVGEKDGKRYALVFLNYLNTKNICSISTMLPKLFKDLIGVQRTKDHKEFLGTLISKIKIDEINELIKSVCDIDWEKMKSEKQYAELLKCAKAASKRRLKRAREDVDRERMNARDYLERYEECIRRINDLNVMLMGAQQLDGVDENMETFINFMISNPSIELRRFDDSRITFDVLSTMRYYNGDTYEIVSADTSKYIFTHIPEDARDKFKKLLDKIFIDEEYKLRVSCSFRFTLDGECSMSVSGNTNEMWNTHPTYMPQPHGMQYNCYGEFAKNWNEALRSGNLLGAITYAIALTEHINWEDQTVAEWMCNTLYHSNKKIIVDKDGNEYNCQEIIKLMEEQ